MVQVLVLLRWGLIVSIKELILTSTQLPSPALNSHADLIKKGCKTNLTLYSHCLFRADAITLLCLIVKALAYLS